MELVFRLFAMAQIYLAMATMVATALITDIKYTPVPALTLTVVNAVACFIVHARFIDIDARQKAELLEA